MSGVARQSAPHHRLRQRGFTLLELCVVLAILMIVASLIFMNAVTAVRNIRLTQSATSYANLLQQARVRAVQDDTYYIIRTNTGITPPEAFVDVAQTGIYSPAAPLDPMMVFLQDVDPMPFGDGPGLSDLESKFLPAAGVATVDTTAPGPAFGPRGLPCKPTAPSGGTCPYLDSTTGTPTSYITFLKNAQSEKWEAVTVTPAGRIGVWSYDGTTWSPLN
ncbi:MAG: prepilin-type N-terminal cleavage/methylation domain-containing protein [Acidobacteriia bacterium]|nr:prepilin-type N-terminal cleavage/methylation domain-containing protein [Terriglobia bacterium]